MGAIWIKTGPIRLTPKGRVAADLAISDGNAEAKYNVYLREDEVVLQFGSAIRERAELAARLLRAAGVDAEVEKAGNRDAWYVWATTDRLAAGREELRRALAEIVRRAAESGRIDAGKAERWLEKFERGRALREGWLKYYVMFIRRGTPAIISGSTNPHSIGREVQRLRAMGLVEGVHFSAKMPEGGRKGYVRIFKRGLAYAAWLSVHGPEERRRLAAEFVDYILRRAREKGGAVYEKALEVVEEGRAAGSLRLAGFEREVGGHLVRVIGGQAEIEKGRRGKPLLRIKITAEVDGVRGEYEVTFIRRGPNNAAVGRAYARADAPGGREADAERLTALIKALTGRGPRVYRRRGRGDEIHVICYRGHLKALARYTELAEAIARWLEETRNPFSPSYRDVLRDPSQASSCLSSFPWFPLSAWGTRRGRFNLSVPRSAHGG